MQGDSNIALLVLLRKWLPLFVFAGCLLSGVGFLLRGLSAIHDAEHSHRVPAALSAYDASLLRRPFSSCPQCVAPESFRVLSPVCIPTQFAERSNSDRHIYFFRCSLVVEQRCSEGGATLASEQQFIGELQGVTLAGSQTVFAAFGDEPEISFLTECTEHDESQVAIRYRFWFDLFDAGDYSLEVRLFLSGDGSLASQRSIVTLSDTDIGPEADCDQDNTMWRSVMLVDAPIGQQLLHLDPLPRAASPSAAELAAAHQIAETPPRQQRAALPLCRSYAGVLPGRWVEKRWQPLGCALRDPLRRSPAPLRYERIFLVGTSETRYLFDAICALRYPSTHRTELAHSTYRSRCGVFRFLSNCDDHGRFGKQACATECSNLNRTLAALPLSEEPLSSRDLVVYSCGLHQYRVSLSQRRAQYLEVRAALSSSEQAADWVVRTTNAVNFRRIRVRRYCWSYLTYTREREALMRNNLRAAAHARLLRELIPAEHLLDVYRITAPLWNQTKDHVHFQSWTYDALAALHLSLWER
mmetsp:Transcript_3612/g.11235  ORF Transcript_3612/g.11235 Transcript_3612/m.11235 type:complete len:526 (-) Transcript_3612:10-1587(-)